MKRPKSITYNIEWNKETGEERELLVTFNYYAGTHFPIDSASLEPNDPPEIEILSATMNQPRFADDVNMVDVWDDLNEKDQQKIIDYIYEYDEEDNREYERD